MSRFTDNAAMWALGLIILLPGLIIVMSELAARLERRGSRFQRTVAIVRTWVLPLVALCVLVLGMLEVDPESAGARWLATALLVAATMALLNFARAFAGWLRDRRRAGRIKPIPELLLVLPRLAIVLVAAWFFFVTIWDVDLQGLAAAAGVTSLVVSLALQDTLSGLASGLLLLGDRPFNPGDWIRVGDLEGRVVDIKWRSTRIENRDGVLLVIPNSNLAKETVFNYDEPVRLHRVTVQVQVAYSNAPNRAKEMLLAAAAATEGVLEEPAPDVKVIQVDDPLMGYEAQMWIDDYTIEPRVRSDFGAFVWYQSHRMNVPLPSPAYDLFHHDPIRVAAEAVMTTDELVERLRQVPLLSELGEPDLEVLAAASHVEVFAAGETILERNAVTRDVYVIWEGLARMVVARADGTDVGVLDIGAGEVFGLLGRSAHVTAPPATVAATDCELVVIDAEAAGVVASRNPTISDALNRLALARRRRVERARAASLFGAGGSDSSGDDAGAPDASNGGDGTDPAIASDEPLTTDPAVATAAEAESA